MQVFQGAYARHNQTYKKAAPTVRGIVDPKESKMVDSIAEVLKKYAKNYDPEMITAGDADFASKTGTDGQGYGYPMTRSVTIGLNINF